MKQHSLGSTLVKPTSFWPYTFLQTVKMKKRSRVSNGSLKNGVQRTNGKEQTPLEQSGMKDLTRQAITDDIRKPEDIRDEEGQSSDEGGSDVSYDDSKRDDDASTNDEEDDSEKVQDESKMDVDSEEEDDSANEVNHDENESENQDKLAGNRNGNIQHADTGENNLDGVSELGSSDKEDSLRNDEQFGDVSAEDNGESWRQMPFAKLKGVGEDEEGLDDDDSEAGLDTMAVSDLPSHTIVEARNDESGLERKLAEITLFTAMVSEREVLPFRESLCITLPYKSPLPDQLAVDDLEREKKFAAAVTTAVHDGLDKLRDQKVKFRRPPDYFAQMVKTDSQMIKVKGRILQQKGRIEAAQTRRNNRDLKKNKKKARQQQIEKEQEKKRQAREQIDAVHRVRKERLQKRAESQTLGADDGDDEFPIEMLDVEQLDDKRTFQKQSDIASGLKKAWKQGNSAFHQERDLVSKGKGSRGNQKGNKKNSLQRGGTKGKNGSGRRKLKPDGSIKKSKISKKRLGKSRRVSKQGGSKK